MTPEQERLANALMEELLAEGWSFEDDVLTAVYEAFMTGTGRCKDFTFTVTWNERRQPELVAKTEQLTTTVSWQDGGSDEQGT